MEGIRGGRDEGNEKVAIDAQAVPDWQRAHNELARLAKSRARLEGDEGHWLLVAAREGTHARLGYGSFVEYIERLFGYSSRWTLEKLRVAEALENLPKTARALDEGSLNWSQVRELTRVGTSETETDWLAAALGKTAREVERLVSGHALGSKPGDECDAALSKHVTRLEVSGEALALFRDAMAKVRRDAGGALDDDQALLLLARHVLGGPVDEGRASYQVSLSVCEHCRRGFQYGRGERVEVDRDVVEMASCDAQKVDEPRPPVENSAHVGEAATVVGPRKRASQTIPPALRRLVLNRDSRRCAVPGCRHALFVDIHHVDPKADGGGHDAANLVTLCGAHHRAAHRGELVIGPGNNEEFRFHHADGSPYGASNLSPGLAEARVKAFRALRSLGFRQTESKQALERAMTDVSVDATTETLLRRALGELGQTRAA